MALSNDEIRIAAERLDHAEKTRKQIRQISLGLALEPGLVVLAGSFIRPIETRKGDTIQVDYGPYGTVSCYFA
jgi:2-keto-4-pentenoate hydratase